jgi:hypothetical protein
MAITAVTERVIISVKGDVSDWKLQLKTMLQALKKQPGYLRTRWGPWHEDMQQLDLLIGALCHDFNLKVLTLSVTDILSRLGEHRSQ